MHDRIRLSFGNLADGRGVSQVGHQGFHQRRTGRRIPPFVERDRTGTENGDNRDSRSTGGSHQPSADESIGPGDEKSFHLGRSRPRSASTIIFTSDSNVTVGCQSSPVLARVGSAIRTSTSAGR